MAFIDASGNGSASTGLGGGAGSQGIPVSAQANASAVGRVGAPGSGGPGANASVHHWVLFYFGFIAVVLFTTGYAFNGKGKK